MCPLWLLFLNIFQDEKRLGISGEYLEDSFQLKALLKISHKDQQVNVSLPLYVLFAEKARSQVQGLIGWVKILKIINKM